MNIREDTKLALVTGGAGLIGSHLSDLLLQEGYGVRIFDNLEPQTHRNGKPSWIPGRSRVSRRRHPRQEGRKVGARRRERGVPPGGLRRLHAGDGQVRARQQLRHGPDARDHPRREPARREGRRRLLPGRLPGGRGGLRRVTASCFRIPAPPYNSPPGTTPSAAPSARSHRPRLPRPRRPRWVARPSTPSPSPTRSGWS